MTDTFEQEQEREPYRVPDGLPVIPVPKDIAAHLVEEHGMTWDRIKVISQFDDLYRRHERIHSLGPRGAVDGHRHENMGT